MVDSQAQSAVVSHVYQQYKMSERRVCELIQIPRSTYRYEKVEDKDKEINRSKERRSIEAPKRPNQKWAMDFMTDSLTNGKKLRTFTIVDIFSRECPVIEIGASIPSFKVIETLDILALERGLPEVIKVDNGPEYTSDAIRKWADEKKTVLEYISPGRPIENGHIESFNGKFREECLNQNAFRTIQKAKNIIEEWRVDYNEFRPHSALGYKAPAEFLRELLA